MHNSLVRSQDLDWTPHATPGVTVAIVHRDEVKRELVGFLQAEPGVRYPFHRHAAIEEIFMLEGDLVVGDEVYSAGDYIRSHPGSSHAPYTNGGCRFFFHTSIDQDLRSWTIFGGAERPQKSSKHWVFRGQCVSPVDDEYPEVTGVASL